MNSKLLNTTIVAAVAYIIIYSFGGEIPALAQDQSPAPVQQKGFATPQSAVDALVQAAASYDVPSLLTILGPDGKDLVSSADTVRDKNAAAAFAAKAKERSAIAIDKKNKNLATLTIGDDDWPLPFPLVKRNGQWYFDSKAGHDEVLRRRIGANELDAIQICRGYVDAQRQYAAEAHDGINQYAQKIISSPGKQDGLVWKNADGTTGGPISDAIARAIAEGYSNKREPYHGYYFKILKGQGPNAQLGRLDYLIQGVMIGGFALVAVPAEYRVTGVQTFVVNQDGVVYQKDVGPDSLNIAKAMELYNPDKTWRRTDDQWPDSVSTQAADNNQ